MDLKGGYTTEDRRLDRIPQFDDRSRQYPIRTLLGNRLDRLRSFTWNMVPSHYPTVLDQGREGACVGFAWANELACRPKVVPGMTEATALSIYRRAQKLDIWPGENYDGTSVLAGAQAVQEMGHMPEYRWAFGITDVRATVCFYGPVVLGVSWYDGMYNPVKGTDGRSRITRTGAIVGGHAILLVGYNRPRNEFLLHNSWGPDWGVRGKAWISYDDLNWLLEDAGEACVPVKR